MAKTKKRIKKKVKIIGIVILVLVLGTLSVSALDYYIVYSENLTPVNQQKEYYNLSDFGYIKEKSQTDYNNNGIDDYQDILNGEKQFAKWNPKYKSNYYAGGYPPVEKEGVCTDLIWYALKNAGYNLKDMINQDIKDTSKKNLYNIEVEDENIDFRRVGIQDTFFYRYAKILDTDIYEVGEFMPGDILVFDNGDHIAMTSDKYNANGVPYLIQNRDETQKQKEEDRLEKTEMKVTDHYRFEYNNKIKDLINKIKE